MHLFNIHFSCDLNIDNKDRNMNCLIGEHIKIYQCTWYFYTNILENEISQLGATDI